MLGAAEQAEAGVSGLFGGGNVARKLKVDNGGLSLLATTTTTTTTAMGTFDVLLLMMMMMLLQLPFTVLLLVWCAGLAVVGAHRSRAQNWAHSKWAQTAVEERVWGLIRLFVRQSQPLDHRLQHGHDCLFVTQPPRPAARAAAAEGATAAGTAAADAAAAGVAASYYCRRRCYRLLALARACV